MYADMHNRNSIETFVSFLIPPSTIALYIELDCISIGAYTPHAHLLQLQLQFYAKCTLFSRFESQII